MPLTPLHFIPATAISLPLNRWLNVPAFFLVNVVIDIEPLTVMITGAPYPLHGYAHTLLFGGIIGLMVGWIIFKTPKIWAELLDIIGVKYKTTHFWALFSGLVGAWLHVVLDSFLYTDIQPLFPVAENPLLHVLTNSQVFQICLYSVIPVAIVFKFMQLRRR